MKLKSLISHCIKYHLQNDEVGFNEESLSDFLDDPSYKGLLNNAINAINRAITRLNDQAKLMYRYYDFTLREPKIDLSSMVLENGDALFSHIGQILSFVGIGTNGQNLPIAVQQLNDSIYQLNSKYTSDIRMFYRERIPLLKFNPTLTETDEALDDRDFELTSIGITDNMCNYIAYYVKGEFLEAERDPDFANFKNLFEQCVAELPTRVPVVLQSEQRYNVFRW